MKKKLSNVLVVILAFIFSYLLFAEEFPKVQYTAGMPGYDKKANGALEITNEKLTFKADEGKFTFSIPIKSITNVTTGKGSGDAVMCALFLVKCRQIHAGIVGVEFKNEEDKSAGFPSFVVKEGEEKMIKSVIEVKCGKTFKNEDEKAPDSDKKKK